MEVIHSLIMHSGACFAPDGEIDTCVCSEKQLKAREYFESLQERNLLFHSDGRPYETF